ncbi:MAG: cytochrome c family protein [Tepidamorphaceae bacterium]|nr:cytochrome c family protein [Rhodobiaceae bacterium]MCC0049046.1 cytochrome c family protein [Rhodobiaceae bacterium]
MKRTTIFAIFTAAAAASVLATSPALAAGDAAHGQEVFAKCASCHQIGDGARNNVGPALNGVYGAPAASRSGFNYSRALNEASKNGLVWTEDNLDRYLENPREFLTGGRMAFAGVPSAEDRADLIAYLKTFP